MSKNKQSVMYVVNHAAFFISHRLPIALRLVDKGASVSLATGQPGSEVMEEGAEETLKASNIDFYRLKFTSSGLNPLREVFGLIQLFVKVLSVKPDIIHTASPKGGLLGGIVARVLGVKKLVVAVSGMGHLFTGDAQGALRVAKWIYLQLIRWIYKHPNITIIVQNSDDRNTLLNQKFASDEAICLIPGSGVHISKYAPIKSEDATKMVLFPARMVRDKGIIEFVTAAKILKENGCDWSFVLAGAADYDNPSAISENKILEWENLGLIKWYRYQVDMVSLYSKSGIVCLPSYREGMPKCLLEAAAAGRAVVTTDVVGCREAILPGITGDLVPAYSGECLADTLEALISDRRRRESYGLEGRKLAEANFCIENIIDKTLQIYGIDNHKANS